MSNVTLERPSAPPAPGHRAKKRPKPIEVQFRTIISPHQLNSRWGRRVYWTVLVATVVTFTVVFLLPMYWMITGALKSAEEFAQVPPTIFPSSLNFEKFIESWELFDIGTLLKNTVFYAVGGWLITMAVDVAAAYALSKLRPAFGNVVLGAMLATLMIPPMVVLIPTYLAIHDVPIFGWDLLNNPWGLWLPAAANGFNIFLLKRFFDSIPRELLEAAQIDGGGPFRILWSVVLPVSRPILGVTSIFTIVTSFKDFIWPLLVMSDSEKMTLSVGLAQTAGAVSQDQVMGGLVIASIPTIIVFFIFQRHIMAGLTAGSLKG
ncbi:MAG: carbohydrate ABC transporter permease [Nonomuraea sp.]|nr:carbohydrate ABC transporter permease [Nonomuraea sp.]NUP63146.1 carbohydrate ABC transporter permease [Nonomuraea sp.]NUP76117.1 carbohydrate ABC transporter permease [Nonomuraea sp.]NUS08588.1 carbohydrate ABC transporter permease [Nonomuraea sp.]NUT10704.1 carbohydrate ABC transporter permease [Nonomuraea sp.]